MKFKKNWKRFWTLNRHHAEGFTLVELIVVIAILAILGGIAVPAYSGYVEKAERAADEQLLAAVNTAFAAACAIKGESHIGRSDVDNQSITNGELVYTGPNATEFGTFYEGGKFKVFTELYYDSTQGGFAENYSVTVVYNGKEMIFSAKQINSLKNSTWGSTVEPEELLNLVSNVTGMAQSIDNQTYIDMLNSPEFSAAATSILGKDMGTVVAEAVEEWKKANPNATDEEIQNKTIEIGKSVTANTAVLVAAQNASVASKDIMTILGSGSAKDTIKTTMINDPTTGLSQAALAYGMYASYVYSTNPDAVNSENPINFVDALNAYNKDSADYEAFQEYLNGPQGQKDIEGYLAALNTVNSNPDAAGDVAVNGFSDQELVDLFGQIMG